MPDKPGGKPYQPPYGMRSDAWRYWRLDAARFYKSGTDVPFIPKSLEQKRLDAKRARLAEEAEAERAKAEAEVERKRWEELKQQHLHLKWMVADLQLTLALKGYTRKYRSDQPRVPAGSPDGGQWTGDEGGPRSSEQAPTDISAARPGGKALEAYCLAQYAIDTAKCTAAGSRTCHAQAALRYGNCLNRKPIPPLNY